MTQSLAEEIRERIGNFTATERRAALALLANYPVLGLGTVAQFAAAAGVSSPTILRFAARLGLSTYAALQTRLRTELEDQLNSPLARAQDGIHVRAPGSLALANAAQANIAETFHHLPLSELEAVVQLISDERRTLYLLGGRFTDALARYMAAHLRILRRRVVHVAGQQGNWRDYLVDMSRKDVLIVFDVRRYQTDLARFAQAASEIGATTVLITDRWLSPIASVATHVLPARVAVPSPWDSSASLMVIAETLVAGVTAADPERSERRMSMLERYRDTEDLQHGGVPSSTSDLP